MAIRNEERGHQEGRLAYMAGQPISANPYQSHAYPYTDQGLAYQGWRDGFIAAWKEELCPPSRCPELADTAFAILSRALEPADGSYRFTHGPTHIDYHRKGSEVGISLLMTDMSALGKGHARTAMSLFLQACDAAAVTVYLTPVATESHVKKQRLVNFYRSLGFAKNRGREVDFWNCEAMSGHYAMCRTPIRPA